MTSAKSANPKVVVVMPVYNAAKTIEKTWREVVAHPEVDLVIVVDERARTKRWRRRDSSKGDTHVHPVNRGYGANQKTCYQLALDHGADIVVMVHPDYQYTPKLIPAMVGLVRSGLSAGALRLDTRAARGCRSEPQNPFGDWRFYGGTRRPAFTKLPANRLAALKQICRTDVRSGCVPPTHREISYSASQPGPRGAGCAYRFRPHGAFGNYTRGRNSLATRRPPGITPLPVWFTPRTWPGAQTHGARQTSRHPPRGEMEGGGGTPPVPW